MNENGGEQGKRSAAAAHRQKSDFGWGDRGRSRLGRHRKNCRAWERAVRNLKNYKQKNGSADCGSFMHVILACAQAEGWVGAERMRGGSRRPPAATRA